MYRRALGAYPTDPYYDPARPSWLPYWIDDPTESQNKAAYALSTGAVGPAGILAAPYVASPTGPGPYSLPPAPPTVQPPSMATDPTGQTVNPDAQSAAQQAAYLAALQDWANKQAAATPVDNLSAGGVANCIAAAATAADYANCIAGNPIGTPGVPSWIFWAAGGLIIVLLFVGGRR